MHGEVGASYRTVLISDLHLGSYRCDAGAVLAFLESHRSRTLYLVGDIIDFWSFRRHSTWRSDHVAVLRRLIEMGRAGTRLIIVPGNHDGPLEHLGLLGLEGIEVLDEAMLRTARGERLLVTHGHRQDPVFGGTHELIALCCQIGEALQLGRWRRSAPASQQSVSRFELALIGAAVDAGTDGVICGHSHLPADRMIEGRRYLNCGDWIGNRTAIVETWAGELRLLHWDRPAPTSVPDDDAGFGFDDGAPAMVTP